MGRFNYFPFYIFLLAVSSVIVLPALVQHGMFMDGIQYACVSKNMAAGKGSFWFPYLCETWWVQHSNNFMEHPPLFYAFESFFFKWFGNGFYTERIFCLTMAIVNAWLIHLTWKLIAVKYALKKQMSWFPVLLWISIPVCFWAFQNNIIEILVSVFTLTSIYFTLVALLKKKLILFFIFLSGFCLFLASLTKGIPALFPVCTIPLFYIFIKEISLKKTILYTIIVVAVPAIIYGFLFLFNEDAKESLSFYVTQRLLYRITNVPSTDSRFFILFGLASELIPAIAISCLLLFVRKKMADTRLYRNYFFFFLCVGLSGTLPLMATMVQNKFYFVPALPFFALAFGMLLYKRVFTLTEILTATKFRKNVLLLFNLILLSGGILYTVSRNGKDLRDNETLSSVREIGPLVQKTSIVSVEKDLYENWGFQFYLLRYYDVSIEPLKTPRPFLVTKTMKPDSSYQLIVLPTSTYSLYRHVAP